MALKLHGYDNTTIKTIVSWNSLNFVQYIHNQITHLSKDVSKHMSIVLPFLNISAAEGLYSYTLCILLSRSGLFMCMTQSTD